MRTLGRFSSGSALFVFPSTSLLFLLFLHFAGYKLYFQVRFFLIFTDLFHAGQDARQLRQFCNRLTVIGLHSRFISTISDKLKLDILIFVRYNKSDNAAVFPPSCNRPSRLHGPSQWFHSCLSRREFRQRYPPHSLSPPCDATCRQHNK